MVGSRKINLAKKLSDTTSRLLLNSLLACFLFQKKRIRFFDLHKRTNAVSTLLNDAVVFSVSLIKVVYIISLFMFQYMDRLGIISFCLINIFKHRCEMILNGNMLAWIANFPGRVQKQMFNTNVKCLLIGIEIDSKLLFDKHIASLCRKAANDLHAICRLQNQMGNTEK